MRIRNPIIILFATSILLLSSGAQAGLITAIGDVDAVNISNRPVNVDLLDNILGANTDVLIIGEWATNSRVTALSAYWNSLAGVNVTATASIDVTPADLIGFDFLFYMEDAFSTNTANATTTAAITNFIASSNDFLYVSQNLTNPARSASYNSFLTDIGSSLGTSTSSCFGASVIAADPLTAGVTDFIIAGCNEVTGGTALVTNRTVSVAYENSANQVPTPATLALIGLGLAGLGWSRRKKA